MSSATPVVLHGISTGSLLIAAIQVVFGSGLVVALVRVWPALKKIATDREANLLTERAEEMDKMRGEIAALQAERQIDRHRINNLTQCLDALLMLIEQDPAKAAEAASRIKAMRAAQMAAEAAEKGAVASAKVQGAVI